MLNVWCGQGRLARDVELRYTASQIPVASFSIACDRDYSPKGGERETDWIDIVAWNKAAEFVSKYFRKGDMIVVNGRIQTRTYEDKNGNKRKAVEVVATSFNFCGKKDSGQNAGQSGQYTGNQQYGGQQYGGQYNGGYAGGGQQSNSAYDDFMKIPDGIDEELPFN